MRVKGFACGSIRKMDGWTVCKYRTVGSDVPTFKVRRSGKNWRFPFRTRWTLAQTMIREDPGRSEEILRWCLTNET